jgi:DNA-binding NarL/FixJ family response regulator
MTVRVLVADDHPPTRLGVRLSLEDAGMEVVADVATADAAVAAVVEQQPDIALLDIHMPGGGISAAREIATTAPDTAIVMLTVSRDDADLFQAIAAGARGYLLKDTDPDRLPLALQGVLDGEAALPRSLVTRLVDEFRARERSNDRRQGPLAKLTDREWEILDRLRQGMTTAQIASKLFVTPVTVRTHVSAILRKLHVADRASAIEVAEGRQPK